MKLIRVFPRKTRATPDDDLAFFGPPGLFPPEADEVHVSVSFTWDTGLTSTGCVRNLFGEVFRQNC